MDLFSALQSEKELLAENPWYRSGAALFQSDFGTPQDNIQAFSFPLIKGLAGGLMAGLGKGQVREQYGQGLVEAMKPYGIDYSAAVQEPDWNPQVGRSALLGAMIKQQNDLEQRKLDSGLQRDLAKQGLMLTPQGVSPIKGYGEAKASIEELTKKPDQLKAFEDTTYKRITDLPSFKQFSDIEGNFKTILATKDRDEAAAAPAMITAFARIMDPTSTVREGEYNTINKNVQGYLDKVAGNWRLAFEGKTSLSKTAREQMALIAGLKFNEFGGKYSSERGALLKALEAEGGNPSHIPTVEFNPYQAPPSKPNPLDFSTPQEYKAAKEIWKASGGY